MDKYFDFVSKNNERIEAFQYFFVALSFLFNIYSSYVPYFFLFLVAVLIFFMTILTIIGNQTLNSFHEEVSTIKKLERYSKKKEIHRRNKLKENINPVLLNMLISIFSITFIFQESYNINYWNFTYWSLFIYTVIMLYSIFSKKKHLSDKYINSCTILFLITGFLLLINSLIDLICN